MAGEFSRLTYDDCSNNQDLQQSTKIFTDYVFNLYQYENTLKSNAVSTCDGKYAHIECNACDVNKDSISATLEHSLIQRLKDESSLLGIDRLNTKCDSNKYQPCYKQKCTMEKDCSYRPIVQPLLCDRIIVPTNMKEYQSPFKYTR